jgi:stress response protein SCP2
MNLNSILLRRKNKILIPKKHKNALSRAAIASFNLNIQELGYTLSPECLEEFRHSGETVLTNALETLKALRGADHKYAPMYPNFPKQVMEADEAELYLNAIMHYFSVWVAEINNTRDCIWLPKYRKNPRKPLDEKVELTVIRRISEEEVYAMGTAIATSNTSLSDADKADLKALEGFGFLDFPAIVPNKENLAILGSLFFASNVDFTKYFKTATDVLRLCVALSNGDVSLAAPTKFTSFSRGKRRRILALLEQCSNLEEDMLRWNTRWIRLGERLHPGEFAKQYPRAYRAFTKLREDIHIDTYRSRVEALVRGGDALQAATVLSERPGEFARRLDHLVRTAKHNAKRVIEAFLAVSGEVSTPTLLQVLTHFEFRNEGALRVIFPKGSLAKVCALPTTMPAMSLALRHSITSGVRKTLETRFSSLPKLGKVYVDPELENYLLPFSQRSANTGLRTLVRGSKIPFSNDKGTIRFFIWWKNTDKASDFDRENVGRVDLDLSAVAYDEKWNRLEDIAYYNLRDREDGFGCHSGDIVDAPEGACEFIDLSIKKCEEQDIRYLAMSVRSYTQQKFSDVPECSAGWMLRDKVQSGQVFDPRTVVDRIDLTTEAISGIPLLIDLKERKVIWMDIQETTNDYKVNNARNNKSTMQLLGHAFTNIHKPNLYELLTLHARSRGQLVNSPEKADVVFSPEMGIQFELERIASEFMADKTIAAKATV